MAGERVPGPAAPLRSGTRWPWELRLVAGRRLQETPHDLSGSRLSWGCTPKTRTCESSARGDASTRDLAAVRHGGAAGQQQRRAAAAAPRRRPRAPRAGPAPPGRTRQCPRSASFPLRALSASCPVPALPRHRLAGARAIATRAAARQRRRASARTGSAAAASGRATRLRYRGCRGHLAAARVRPGRCRSPDRHAARRPARGCAASPPAPAGSATRAASRRPCAAASAGTASPRPARPTPAASRRAAGRPPRRWTGRARCRRWSGPAPGRPARSG